MCVALLGREDPDSVNREALQGAAQGFEILAGDYDETVLESNLKCLVAGTLDQLGMLEVPVREQVDLARFLHPQAMGVGIRLSRPRVLNRPSAYGPGLTTRSPVGGEGRPSAVRAWTSTGVIARL